MHDPITTLTPEEVERGREFVKDLRANKKKAIGIMRDKLGGRCCLCVAYDVAQRLGAKLPGLAEEGTMPPLSMGDFYGWDDNNPGLHGIRRFPSEVDRMILTNASDWNDGDGVPEKTHKEIADMFEERYPQLKIS